VATAESSVAKATLISIPLMSPLKRRPPKKRKLPYRFKGSGATDKTDHRVFRNRPQSSHRIFTFALLTRTRVSIICLLRSEAED
jgi:hypothetical protein